MNFLNIIITLTGLATTALSTTVPRSMLPDCTDNNNGTTACGSLNSYGNDIFQCNNLHWNWIVRCHDPDTPCNNGACVPLPAECTEGEMQCLTTLNNGYDGINMCKNGKWEVRDTCRCTDTPSPQCVDAALSSRDDHGNSNDNDHDHDNDNLGSLCEEGVPKCMLRESNGNGGVLFRCKNGFWKIAMHCDRTERCHDGELATCSWRGAAAVAN
jgi:hypothetical protein